tara:strand:- start:39 stop:380 length:342 start_codon:yes stop_codon:yes gene_type:complete
MSFSGFWGPYINRQAGTSLLSVILALAILSSSLSGLLHVHYQLKRAYQRVSDQLLLLQRAQEDLDRFYLNPGVIPAAITLDHHHENLNQFSYPIPGLGLITMYQVSNKNNDPD